MAVPQTTLSAAIATAGATTATVRDVLGFASSSDTDDVVQVDSELMLVAGGLATLSWSSITRGYSSTTAATHANGATVTRIVRGWTDLTKVKTQAKITVTTDDAFLLDQVEAANSWLTSEIGMFIGPSTDTSRTFDIPSSARTLEIPGGLRSLTSVTVGQYTGATHETVTAGDVVLRPEAWRLLDGLTYDRLEFLDIVTGDISRFYPGRATVTVTGVFGPAEPPPVLSRIATTLVVWLWQSRQSGSTGIIGSLETGELIVNRVLSPMDGWTMQRYRNATRSYAWVSGR